MFGIKGKVIGDGMPVNRTNSINQGQPVAHTPHDGQAIPNLAKSQTKHYISGRFL